MAFIKENIKALFFVFMAILSQSIIVLLPFHWGVIDGINYTWGEMLYHFVGQGMYLALVPNIYFYKESKNINSKGILLGLIIWSVVELLQLICALCHLDIPLLDKYVWSKVDEMQVIFIIFTVILTYLAHKCYTSSLLSRLTLYMSTHIEGILKKAYRILRKR